jgi:inhibitor of the pro-sigma K processing machinery
MIMGLSYETAIAYLFIFIVVIMLLVMLAAPLKWLVKVLINSLIGALALTAFNFVGHYMNFTVGVNPGSMLTVGILGIPGFILIVFLRSYLF